MTEDLALMSMKELKQELDRLDSERRGLASTLRTVETKIDKDQFKVSVASYQKIEVLTSQRLQIKQQMESLANVMSAIVCEIIDRLLQKTSQY